ncbi:MAG: DUF2284 domain-containing protein [Bacillota bacterium]
MDNSKLEALFKEHGYNDFKWIKASDIKVSHWVRFKCQFGCPGYGKKITCPPHVPSIEECREFISEYKDVVIFHFAKAVDHPDDRKPWGREVNYDLIKLEREVFLSGYQKAFMIPFESCGYCGTCVSSRLECKNPKISRPGPDALGIDVYDAVRKVGYPVQVLKDYKETMNRYAFLLVE